MPSVDDLPPAPYDLLVLLYEEVVSRTLALEAALSCAQAQIVVQTPLIALLFPLSSSLLTLILTSAQVSYSAKPYSHHLGCNATVLAGEGAACYETSHDRLQRHFNELQAYTFELEAELDQVLEDKAEGCGAAPPVDLPTSCADFIAEDDILLHELTRNSLVFGPTSTIASATTIAPFPCSGAPLPISRDTRAPNTAKLAPHPTGTAILPVSDTVEHQLQLQRRIFDYLRSRSIASGLRLIIGARRRARTLMSLRSPCIAPGRSLRISAADTWKLRLMSLASRLSWP